MRKAMFLLAVAALGWSCTAKEEAPELRFQEIRVGIRGVESGSIGTKSGVSDALSGTVPTGVPTLKLESTEVSTRVYSVRAGETVSIPVGTYRVSGEYRSEKVGQSCGNGLYFEPTYEASGVIEVVSGVDSYSVGAAYTCAAIAVKTADVARVDQYYKGMSEFGVFDGFKTVGDVKIVYMRLSYAITWRLRVYPVDVTNQEMREFCLVSDHSESGTVFVENGKWYLFGPRDVDREEGMIDITLPDFGEGSV